MPGYGDLWERGSPRLMFRLVLIGGAAVLAGAFAAIVLVRPGQPDRRSAFTEALPDDPDFPRMAAPKVGEWLYLFRERGQTVEDYTAEGAGRRRPGIGTIVVQPLGEILETRGDAVEAARAYTALFFGCPAEIAAAAPLPSEAFNAGRRQCNADRVLDFLQPRIPDGAVAMAGLCEEDLFARRFSFLFGLARSSDSLCVLSISRFGPKDARDADGEPLFLRRVLKIFVHETAHLFGLEHCVRFRCVINGSISLPEMDGQPTHLCPECLEKLRGSLGFDVRERYRRLAAFYEASGFERDAAFARRQAGKAGP